MSTYNNNKSFDACTKSWLLHRHVSTQYILRGHVRSVYTVPSYIYVCSVYSERTVLLVPLILLGIVNVLVDNSA